MAKYADALPLYRLEKILKRYGATISRTTIASWIIRLDGVSKPLIELIRAHQLSGGRVGCRVLAKGSKSATEPG